MNRRNFFGKLIASVLGLLGMGAVVNAVPASPKMIRILRHRMETHYQIDDGLVLERVSLGRLWLSEGDCWDDIAKMRFAPLATGHVRKSAEWRYDLRTENVLDYRFVDRPVFAK